jgi:molybdopterin molybdotransferase
MGELALWAIAIKPGKPFAYGHLRRPDDTRCHFIGLPGNPVSSLVTFLVLVRPFLQRLSGRTPSTDAPIEALASFDWLKPDNRREFLRASLTPEGVVGHPNQGSNVLTSVAASDVLIDNPPGQLIHKGDKVRCYPLRSWMMGD